MECISLDPLFLGAKHGKKYGAHGFIRGYRSQTQQRHAASEREIAVT